MALSTIGSNSIADGALTTVDFQDASITAAKMANSGYELGMRNRIINGDFRIWQRGTNATSHAVAAYGPDRWRVYGGNALTLTSTQTFGSPQSLLIQATGTNHGIGQRIEATNIADLAGQTVTISYKIRADYPGTHNLLMYYGNAVNDFSSEVNFLNVAKSYSTNTVTTITHTVTLPALAGNGVSLVFQWYNGGATFNETAFIWDVQLEAGSTATPFERRSYTIEDMLCRRYYTTTAIGGVHSLDSCLDHIAYSSSDTHGERFPVMMRTIPTVTLYGRNGNANPGYISKTSDGSSLGSTSAANSVSPIGFRRIITGSGVTGYPAWALEVSYNASAEL
jgi:hypothetical protein